MRDRKPSQPIGGGTVHEFERSQYDETLCVHCGNKREATIHATRR